MKCLLCNENHANQTGAHVIPAWMVATAFDKDARTRGYEIVYAIGSLDTGVPYFGRSVPTKQIQEQIGRDLTDEEIENQKNLYVVDGLWCRSCEKRFKILEDYFLENVHRKTQDFSGITSTTVKVLEEMDKYIIRLFLYSLIYRSSLSKLQGFSLNPKSQKKLQYFLNNYLKEDLETTIGFIKKSPNKDQLLKYPLVCIKGEEQPGEANGLVFMHPMHNKPYCFILNNYILQFYGRGNQANFSPNSFYGISTLRRDEPSLRNYKEDHFKIGLMNSSSWKDFVSHFSKSQYTKVLSNYVKVFELMYKKKNGELPSRVTIGLFLKELIENDLPLGVKYSKENIVAAMNRTL